MLGFVSMQLAIPSSGMNAFFMSLAAHFSGVESGSSLASCAHPGQGTNGIFPYLLYRNVLEYTLLMPCNTMQCCPSVDLRVCCIAVSSPREYLIFTRLSIARLMRMDCWLRLRCQGAAFASQGSNACIAGAITIGYTLRILLCYYSRVYYNS